MDSLMRVRYQPNGRIDFLSVDEMARLNANTSGRAMEHEGHRASHVDSDS